MVSDNQAPFSLNERDTEWFFVFLKTRQNRSAVHTWLRSLYVALIHPEEGWFGPGLCYIA